MQIAISLMGGLGLFLYGMNLMADGLQKSAGEKLKRIVELLTSNVLMGVLVGALVTAIIQSSSATTVMVVGFVNAGIMTLPQAIGVIMGANIGTTITAQLVSLDLVGIAPLALGIGIVIYLFSKNQKAKTIAEILIGFGILFTGMDFMKEAVKPLAEFKGFTDALVAFSNQPILGILLGFGITAIVQSSSASMGMLLALASQGLIPLTAALPILYGENIGTCVTSLISSIGASINARRAAVMHLVFNVIGTIVFMLILTKPITMIVQNLNPDDVSRQIANAHTLFNVINVILLLPFSKYIVKLTMKLMPEKESEKEKNKTVHYIDERMMETPSIALSNTVKETLRMGEKAKSSLNNAMEGFLEKSKSKVDASFEEEKLINKLQKSILNYLLKLSKTSLNDDSRESVDLLFNTVNDIERVGDHAENIAELASSVIEGKLSLSEGGEKELRDLYDKVMETYNTALDCMEKSDVDLACRVIKLEEQVDMMEKSCRLNHMRRLNENSCSVDSGVIFLDLISNLERVADHSANIAQQVIKESNKNLA
ncbi:Na/Pi cotransporter family protein [Paraclostridium sordellii]|uniref:Na/Pi-cotransporter family protein/PhoU family protein n=1 Tax=Paraclostridium sordellii TaxID=1505 RepID=A0A0A1SER6_PARSO|nr:Na/Pi cotransporter family protein [Paeniclostridium sordellii]AUN13520.1 sodium-dependent phosphate transporter [Paeniclostridium sordellii]MCR1849223.1 Na/Pi cotransporter family protein [Paeniclostridium sordellii]QYE98749.1 Na/Pi cotransporter family protein [Paeniclostridium sordellii]RGX13787.1 Na/Pi cotransporter family protein [Paeniclostridium sordellii]TAN69689.1 Na/Pi cotransporter family protein [Paeniclostridium sordellii 8483]